MSVISPRHKTDQQKRVFFRKIKEALSYLKEHKKQLFWYWIAYQAVKGILTTSLIWIPLIYLWLRG